MLESTNRPLPIGSHTEQPLEPVGGDLLPAVGSEVLIHLARSEQWVKHTVIGYYVWGNLDGDPYSQRVFVRVRDADGIENSRLLADVLVFKGEQIHHAVSRSREFLPLREAIEQFGLNGPDSCLHSYDVRLHDGSVLTDVAKTPKGLIWVFEGAPQPSKHLLVDLARVHSIRIHKSTAQKNANTVGFQTMAAQKL